MQDQLKALATVASLAIIIIFTWRGCSYCLQGLSDDNAGFWVTVSEVLSAMTWTLIGVDALAYNTLHPNELVTGAIFWLAMAMKSVSVIVKSEKGYRGIRDAYRNRGRW